MFRDPRTRLVSWYRFCKAHAVIGRASNELFIRLANELDPEEFFEHPSVITSPLNNSYMFYFGSALTDRGFLTALRNDMRAGEMLSRAKENVLGLHALGLTERFGQSVDLIFKTLGIPIPESIIPAQVTDELAAADPHLASPPGVEMTTRLEHALTQLTVYDQEIYDAAVNEFDRRVSNLRNVVGAGGECEETSRQRQRVP